MTTSGGSTSPPVIELRDLHKEFKLGVRLKRVQAVRGVTLEVRAGEIFGFLGPNGAGKTTTMKMMMGLIGPTSGSVRLFGGSVEEPQVRQRIGYLPEQPYFYDYLTVTELLDFYGRIFGLPKAVRRRRTEELVELVGLTDARHRTLRRFSKGMLQRAGVAQALVNDPELVVLDEPLSGLDPMGRKEVRDIIVSLHRRGKTVFFSSHILHDIETICDRVALIDRGTIQRTGRLDEMLAGSDSLVEVVARGVPERAMTALRELGAAVESVGHGVTMKVDEGQLAATLRILIDAEAQVGTVSSGRSSLEEVFVREAGGRRDQHE